MAKRAQNIFSLGLHEISSLFSPGSKDLKKRSFLSKPHIWVYFTRVIKIWKILDNDKYTSFLFYIDQICSKNHILLSLIFSKTLCFTSYNPGQNIWHNVKKYSKIGQGFKNILSTFKCFLTAIVNVSLFFFSCVGNCRPSGENAVGLSFCGGSNIQG